MTYTYIFRDSKSFLTKIGKSRQPRTRFDALRPGRKLVPICCFIGDQEKQMHERFREKRNHGEWFNLSILDLSNLRKHNGNLCSDIFSGRSCVPIGEGEHEWKTIKVSKDIHRALKRAAAARGMKISDLVNEILTKTLINITKP